MPRLLAVFLLLCLTACSNTPPAPGERDLDHGVIVHLFQWPWESVGRECAVLGPAGVAAVQISPPQEHRVLPGNPWYADYQPVSYQLTSRRGDRVAFSAMISQCHTAGVKVYADAVINHMAAGMGQSFPKVPYTAAAFHDCGRSISNYQDRFEVQNCQLVGLADLATEQEAVQARIAGYLNDLLALGVDGFRIDAAKHIAAADLRAILGKLTKPAYIYSEVLFSTAEPIKPEEYQDFGTTLEPRFGEILARHFRGDSLTLLETRLKTLLPNAVTYVDSHDTQRGSSTLSYKDEAQHTLAVQLMLGHPYGTPLVMSSFAFNGFDDGPPSLSDGTTKQVVCGEGWVCEHRAVLSMIRFREAVKGAEVQHLWATDTALGFARAGKGYVAVNRSAEPVRRTVQTGLNGTFKDVITGQTHQISGELTLTIPAFSALALIKE